jgi:hypothetical protein
MTLRWRPKAEHSTPVAAPSLQFRGGVHGTSDAGEPKRDLAQFRGGARRLVGSATSDYRSYFHPAPGGRISHAEDPPAGAPRGVGGPVPPAPVGGGPKQQGW